MYQRATSPYSIHYDRRPYRVPLIVLLVPLSKHRPVAVSFVSPWLSCFGLDPSQLYLWLLGDGDLRVVARCDSFCAESRCEKG